MKVSRVILQQAVDLKIINSGQAEALFELIKNQPEQESAFNLTNVLYYFGGFLALGAMLMFMHLSWKTIGSWGIFSLSLFYIAIGLCLSEKFHKQSLMIPSGICAIFVIFLTPLAIYAFQFGMGWWSGDTIDHDDHLFLLSKWLYQWNWFYIELGALAVAVILAERYRYAFMVIPIAVALWYIAVDMTTMLTGGMPHFTLSALVSLYFGLVFILLAFWVDLKSKSTIDYAFWLYLIGVITFWGGMTAQETNTELLKFLYLCINLLMMGLGVILMRKEFDVFGAIGSSIYLGHLTSQVFQDSLLYPLALTIIGFLIIYLGTLWQKNAELITRKAQSILPKQIRELLQSHQNARKEN